MTWNLNVIFGEMIGSLILTLGIMMTALVVKKESFGIKTKWQSKIFTVLSVFAIVVVSIITAKGFGAPGAINPAVEVMLIMYKINQLDSIWLSTIIFDFVGGILGAIILILFVKLMNIDKTNSDKIEISKIFKFNKQNPYKNIGMEIVANMFWLLPILGMVMLHKGNAEGVGQYLIPISAGFAVVATLATTTEMGVANLNPQVWLGEFIVKLHGNKYRINKKQFISEISSLVSVVSVAVIWGLVGYGINLSIPKK